MINSYEMTRALVRERQHDLVDDARRHRALRAIRRTRRHTREHPAA